MATTNEVRQVLAKRLIQKKIAAGATVAEIQSVLTGLSPSEWGELRTHVNSRNQNAVGEWFLRKIAAAIRANADAQALTIYPDSDPTLSHAEIEQVFF